MQIAITAHVGIECLPIGCKGTEDGPLHLRQVCHSVPVSLGKGMFLWVGQSLPYAEAEALAEKGVLVPDHVKHGRMQRRNYRAFQLALPCPVRRFGCRLGYNHERLEEQWARYTHRCMFDMLAVGLAVSGLQPVEVAVQRGEEACVMKRVYEPLVSLGQVAQRSIHRFEFIHALSRQQVRHEPVLALQRNAQQPADLVRVTCQEGLWDERQSDGWQGVAPCLIVLPYAVVEMHQDTRLMVRWQAPKELLPVWRLALCHYHDHELQRRLRGARSRVDQRHPFTTGFQAALHLHIARAIRTVDRQTDLVLEVAVEAPEDLLQEGLRQVSVLVSALSLIARIEVVLELDALQRDALQPLRQLRSARVCALLPVGKREP